MRTAGCRERRCGGCKETAGPAAARQGRPQYRRVAETLAACEVVIEPEDKQCPCCAGALHVIGEDVSEMLDVIPAVIQVKRLRRPRYGCRGCEEAVVQAKAPPRLVENGMATTALIAHVAVAKFAWHLPLHRQTQMLRGHGVDLDRSTLSLWMQRAAWWLKPLHELLTETILSSPKVFCDDTPLPVLDRRRRRARLARFWCYATDDRPWCGPAPPAVVYLFANNRKGRHAAEHLTNFSGVLQVDAYAGYSALTKPNRPGGAITLAYCLAHARRRFFQAYKETRSPIAGEALRRIQRIYEIEDKARGAGPAERVRIRQSESKPLFDQFKPWLMAQLAEISAKSRLAGAIKYMLAHWEGLSVFLDDGRVEVDSNTVERNIRPIALGRKNSLFAGSEGGAEAWSILASVINTAKLHDIDPQTYLADVLDRMVSGKTKATALRELLPWNWKAARDAQPAAAA